MGKPSEAKRKKFASLNEEEADTRRQIINEQVSCYF
jgi:hypothetical protein